MDLPKACLTSTPSQCGSHTSLATHSSVPSWRCTCKCMRAMFYCYQRTKGGCEPARRWLQVALNVSQTSRGGSRCSTTRRHSSPNGAAQGTGPFGLVHTHNAQDETGHSKIPPNPETVFFDPPSPPATPCPRRGVWGPKLNLPSPPGICLKGSRAAGAILEQLHSG